MKLYLLRYLLFIVLVCCLTVPGPVCSQPLNNSLSSAIDIGTRRELFLDELLIDKLLGKAERRLHHPELREVAIVHNEPWEGNTSGYHSVFKDGEIFRMYYRGSQINLTKEKFIDAHPFYICYAESKDGIHWEKPDIGIYNFKGSKKNNIVLAEGLIGDMQLNLSDNATMFKDKNPNVSPDARYKAIVCSSNPRGLFAFKSSDAIHWLPMSNIPIITDGAFDSQNIAFWDSIRSEYRAYWRIIENNVRGIRTATSKDFIHWENHSDLEYMDSSNEQLYTNQIITYYRAPYLFIGLPTRYIERGWSNSMRTLPQLDYRILKSSHSLRYGTALTDAMLMSSRDGIQFHRWGEAFLRPGIERPGTWDYGQQYIGWGLIETKSNLKGAPNEISLYATESSWTSNAPTSNLRRYTLRLDGFVSVNAPMSGGSFLSKPIIFQGKQLSLNFSTSAAGSIQVEIQDVNGNPLPGFTLKDCSPIFGNTIERIVTWKGGTDVSSLVGKKVRLMFVLKDADLYSFQFQK